MGSSEPATGLGSAPLFNPGPETIRRTRGKRHRSQHQFPRLFRPRGDDAFLGEERRQDRAYEYDDEAGSSTVFHWRNRVRLIGGGCPRRLLPARREGQVRLDQPVPNRYRAMRFNLPLPNGQLAVLPNRGMSFSHLRNNWLSDQNRLRDLRLATVLSMVAALL